jgi:hypothetical protein
MNTAINSIDEILPNTTVVGKAPLVRMLMKLVLRKIVDCKQQHRNVLTEATTTLDEFALLPKVMVINNVLPFLDLPSCTFEGDY